MSNETALKLSSIFTDHMVLQQGVDVPVWGTARPRQRVSVEFAGQRVTSEPADSDGRWRATLKPLKASSTPQELRASSDDGASLTVRDVLVGEIWIGSGQSNMQWPLNLSRDAQDEIAAAKFPNIRLFTVLNRGGVEPQENVTPRESIPEAERTPAHSQWVACTPESAGPFSAVLYFFGRHLRRELNVPIGLINTSWGGTPAESWTSRAALNAEPALKPLLERNDKLAADFPRYKEEYKLLMRQWEDEWLNIDPGNKGEPQGWARPGHDTSDWQTMRLPILWERLGLNIDGGVWFRLDIDVPAAWSGKDLSLQLGPVDDFDTTYFNGDRVGGIDRETPEWWAVPRTYPVPGRLVKAGKNTIAVRVWDWAYDGGFRGTAEQMRLVRGGTSDFIPLAGDWLYKIEIALPQVTERDTAPPPTPPQPIHPGHEWYPGALYNGMIHPLIPFAIKGATWYQGESNADRAEQYRTVFSAMIRDWRKRWGYDFPFLFVQLANYMPAKREPGESTWAELREAQSIALKLRKTGQAVIIDVGDAADIHPTNKQDVGRRLALAAESIAYGRKVTYSGPAFDSMRINGDTVRLSFTHTGGGLVARGGALKGFALAGADRKFHWADATIEGETVILRSPKVSQPVAARYAWADNPEATLFNKEGLPASPFRTDDWPGLTAGKF